MDCLYGTAILVRSSGANRAVVKRTFFDVELIAKKMLAFCRIEKGRRPIDWGGVSSWFLSAVGRYMSLTR